MYSLDYRVNCL